MWADASKRTCSCRTTLAGVSRIWPGLDSSRVAFLKMHVRSTGTTFRTLRVLRSAYSVLSEFSWEILDSGKSEDLYDKSSNSCT